MVNPVSSLNLDAAAANLTNPAIPTAKAAAIPIIAIPAVPTAPPINLKAFPPAIFNACIPFIPPRIPVAKSVTNICAAVPIEFFNASTGPLAILDNNPPNTGISFNPLKIPSKAESNVDLSSCAALSTIPITSILDCSAFSADIATSSSACFCGSNREFAPKYLPAKEFRSFNNLLTPSVSSSSSAAFEIIDFNCSLYFLAASEILP